MSIFSLKLKLQRSIQAFSLAIIYSAAMLFITMYYRTDKWILGLLPSIVILSFIGEFAVARAIVRLTAVTGHVEEQKGDEFESRFAGISGLNGLLYALIPLIFCTAYIVLFALRINILDFVIVNWFVTLSLFIVTAYFLHRTINELSFAFLFISIIYSWTNIAKANKLKNRIDGAVIPESIDIQASFKRLAKKYTKRIEWFENNINEKNKAEYEHKISIYQNILRDFEDLMNGIDA